MSKQIHGGWKAHWGNRIFLNRIFLNMDPHQLLRIKFSFVLPENVSSKQRTGGLGGSLHQVPLSTGRSKALQVHGGFLLWPSTHKLRLWMQRQNGFCAHSAAVSQACRTWRPSITPILNQPDQWHPKRSDPAAAPLPCCRC